MLGALRGRTTLQLGVRKESQGGCKRAEGEGETEEEKSLGGIKGEGETWNKPEGELGQARGRKPEGRLWAGKPEVTLGSRDKPKRDWARENLR